MAPEHSTDEPDKPEPKRLIRLRRAGPSWIAAGCAVSVGLTVIIGFEVDAASRVPIVLAVLTATILVWLFTFLMLKRGVIAPLDDIGAAVRANDMKGLNDVARRTAVAEFHTLIAAFTSFIVLEQQRSEELNAAMRLRTAELTESLERLQRTQDMLRRHERLASLGQLAAGVAHEVNNPAGYIRNNLEMLDRYVRDINEREREFRRAAETSASVRELSERMNIYDRDHDLHFVFSDLPEVVGASRTGIERIIRIASSLTAFSRAEDGNLHPVRVADSVRTAVDMIRTSLPDDIAVELTLDEDVWVCASPGRLEQVFVNLLSNARDALMSEASDSHNASKKITLQIWHGPIEEGVVTVSVRDNGCGMDAKVAANALNPFFTTKAVGEGTGLGLSIAHEIVDGIGGSLDIQSEEGRGTAVLVRLPDCGGSNGYDSTGNRR